MVFDSVLEVRNDEFINDVAVDKQESGDVEACPMLRCLSRAETQHGLTANEDAESDGQPDLVDQEGYVNDDAPVGVGHENQGWEARSLRASKVIEGSHCAAGDCSGRL